MRPLLRVEPVAAVEPPDWTLRLLIGVAVTDGPIRFGIGAEEDADDHRGVTYELEVSIR